MSYEIVYAKQFIKMSDGKIIPLAQHGSNNCYQVSFNGRQKRERNWSTMYFKNLALTKEEIMEKIKSCCGGSYQEHFMKNGKWVDDKGLIKFYENGIKDAKTIEELKEKYNNVSLSGYVSIWRGSENTIELRTSIYNDEDLEHFIKISEERYNNKNEEECIYICLKFNQDLVLKEKKTRTINELKENFYVVCVSPTQYLSKLTSKHIHYGNSLELAKKFKTEKDVDKYIEELNKKKIPCTFSKKFIDKIRF